MKLLNSRYLVLWILLFIGGVVELWLAGCFKSIMNLLSTYPFNVLPKNEVQQVHNAHSLLGISLFKGILLAWHGCPPQFTSSERAHLELVLFYNINCLFIFRDLFHKWSSIWCQPAKLYSQGHLFLWMLLHLRASQVCDFQLWLGESPMSNSNGERASTPEGTVFH
jgi:hypothetical protein